MASLLEAVQGRAWRVRDRKPGDQDDDSVDYDPYLNPGDAVIRGQGHILALDGSYSSAETELLHAFFRERGMKLEDVVVYEDRAVLYISAPHK